MLFMVQRRTRSCSWSLSGPCRQRLIMFMAQFVLRLTLNRLDLTCANSRFRTMQRRRLLYGGIEFPLAGRTGSDVGLTRFANDGPFRKCGGQIRRRFQIAWTVAASIGAPLIPAEQIRLHVGLVACAGSDDKLGDDICLARWLRFRGGKSGRRNGKARPGIAPQLSDDVYSAVLGSIRRRTAEIRLAGIPTRFACSWMMVSSGAR